MSRQRLDYLIAGPAAPYRGGIADTQNELGKHLVKAGKKNSINYFFKTLSKFFVSRKKSKKKRKFKHSCNYT